MQTTTFLLVIAAAIVALGLVFYQYFHQKKSKYRYYRWLALLRFTSIFCGLLLLINPKFTKNEFSVEKSKLLLLIDNSASMLQHTTSTDLLNQIKKVQSQSEISERFDLMTYAFGTSFDKVDSLDFSDGASNISLALEKSAELFSSENTSIVLFTDGNQTLGKDYEFAKLPSLYKINPVVVGDTVTYQDLAVTQVNLNKYAFLKNQFPVESVITYEGDSPIDTQVDILFDGTRVYREKLRFQNGEKSKTISNLIEANSVGVKSVEVVISKLENEKNINNNVKETAIEVIDERTMVLLISEITHPDVGALKKAIESNEQREVEIVSSSANLSNYENVDIIVTYQPNSLFQPIYDFIESRRIPLIEIVGTHSDLQWINNINEQFFEIELGYPEQEVFGTVDNSFSYFNTADFDFGGYPPLSSNVGAIDFKVPNDVLLGMNVRGIELENPMMTILSDDEIKKVVLFGDNIWKWRLHNYRSTGDFLMFDTLIAKLMVYLSKSSKRNRLEVDYDKVYDGSQLPKIKANFYDKTFTQNSQAELTIQLRGKDNAFVNDLPLLFKGNYFEVDLSTLNAGEYDFTITETEENISLQGSFKVLDFDTENQFITANHKKLKRLADRTNGKTYHLNQIDDLIQNLSENDQYVPIQKNNQKIVPLIDFRWLLALMVLTLSAEWFIRKYNGLL